MNIHAYLRDGEAFAPGDMHALETAYELVALELPSGHQRLEEVARQIIAMALRGERDPVLLCDEALAHFGMLPPSASGPAATDAFLARPTLSTGTGKGRNRRRAAVKQSSNSAGVS